jgi:hypothetical protein
LASAGLPPSISSSLARSGTNVTVVVVNIGDSGIEMLGTTNFSAAQSVLDTRMLDMCEAMKAQDIIMYTITFGGTPDSGTQQLYRDCATEEDMYYHAPTNSQLQQVFVTIADELTKLRIAE